MPSKFLITTPTTERSLLGRPSRNRAFNLLTAPSTDGGVEGTGRGGKGGGAKGSGGGGGSNGEVGVGNGFGGCGIGEDRVVIGGLGFGMG